jgi:aminoglycoside phosphotransferase (APT) family kinase protein
VTEAQLSPSALTWVSERIGEHSKPLEVRGLRFGESPWLIRFEGRDVVLRVSDDADAIETERVALEALDGLDIPTPRVLGASVEGDACLLLTERIAGDSAIPRKLPIERLRTLGAVAARLAALPAPAGLPHRTAPIGGVDFAALRRQSEPNSLLQAAEQAIAGFQPSGADVFVHGDLWEGNAMWDGDRLTGVIDWDCAGNGKPGIDLGALRGDAVQNFGLGAEEHVLDGWEEQAGHRAMDVAYWDVVTALATPPDMGWFVDVVQSQGRPDLTRELLLGRRDEFLRQAMGKL